MTKRHGREPLKEEEKRPINKTALRKLYSIFRFMLPYKWAFIIGIVALVFSSTTTMLFPRLSGELLDAANGKGKYFGSINSVALALVGVLFVQAIFSFVRVYTFSIVSEKGIADLRNAVYKKILWMPMTFYDQRRVGELMSRITADVGTLHELLSFTLAEVLRQVLTLVIGVFIIFFITPKLTGFMLLTFPVLILLALIFGKFIRKLSRTTQDRLAEANVVVEESLQSITVVKAFTNESFETSRYSKVLKEVVNVSLKAARYRGLFISNLIFTLFGGIVAVGWYGATLLAAGEISVGELFSFVLYTAFIGASIAGLGDIYSLVQRSLGSSERVMEILDLQDEDGTPSSPVKLNGEIIFDNVSFAYPTRPEQTVVDKFSFHIRAGEKIALVGQSGAGKSTIISLLLRFYPVTTGRILVDDLDTLQFNLSAYRQNIGIVPQEIILFGGTIRENIAYGRPGASEEQIWEAARKANALEFIERFKDKFDTVVGERGVKLSGGQRQRVAIARAILKDPAILILDEATSSLDSQSEVYVQEAMEKLMEGRTTIIIAHRLSTIRKVDRIFVLKDGKLAETGSHMELKERDNGIYSNLLKLQLP